jgi:hypothetical protein
MRATMRHAVGMSLVLGIGLMLSGCGGGAADENKPISEVKAEAKQMDVAALRDMAMAYKSAITSKLSQVGAVKEKIKEIPPMELLGEEAKSLKGELDVIMKSVNALKDRFKVYYDHLKDAKGDLSGLDL